MVDDKKKPIVRSRRPRMTPEQRRRKKITQITFGVLVFLLIALIAGLVQMVHPRGAFTVLIGAALGYTLQRSRFCFTASLRDPVLTGGTDLTKAVIVGLTVSSVLFASINMSRLGLNLEHYGSQKIAGNVYGIGWNTVVGSFLFGIGAVISGGCASGTLMRMGEGFYQQWVAIIFFIFGAVLGEFLLYGFKVAGLFHPDNTFFLPKVLGGWVPAFIVQMGLLFVLYLVADIWGRKKARSR